jgi:hypothetical protein
LKIEVFINLSIQEFPMTHLTISPLRQRMIEDMTARNFGEKTQTDYIRSVKKPSTGAWRTLRQK